MKVRGLLIQEKATAAWSDSSQMPSFQKFLRVLSEPKQENSRFFRLVLMDEILQKDRQREEYINIPAWRAGPGDWGTVCSQAAVPSCQLLSVPASQLEFQPGCPQVPEAASRIEYSENKQEREKKKTTLH